MRRLLLTALIAVRAGLPATAAEAAMPPGVRTNLAAAVVFIPEGANATPTTTFDLTLHLHGAPAVVERNFIAARSPGILANVTLPGLSAVYARHFATTNAFWEIVRDAADRLRSEGGPPPLLRRLTVTSFSAGFGGVRELLKDEAIFERIDTLVMADSIYAGFAGDPAERRVDPANMAGFLRFAREAVAGRKRLLITHTQLATPTYASTVETADHLIARLGGEHTPANEDWGNGLRLLNRFQRGQCEILGFAGATGEDHLQHLRQLARWLRRASEDPAD